MSKRILCYGDSNTWGYVPRTDDAEERFPSNVRWTGVLQKKGGGAFTIFEEGLNGRTTGVDDPLNEGKNGLTALKPTLQKYLPLDLVILMLGTNDLKLRFHSDPLAIAARMRTLIHQTREVTRTKNGATPEILLVSAVVPDPEYSYDDFRYEEIVAIGNQLNLHYEKMAKLENVGFLNIGEQIQVSPTDGVHLDAGAHRKLADVIFQNIQAWVRMH